MHDVYQFMVSRSAATPSKSCKYLVNKGRVIFTRYLQDKRSAPEVIDA